MKKSIQKGISFGLTSGVITTLGLITGLDSNEASRMIMIGGIITIAIADSFSDALGAHVSEETTNKKATNKEIWEVTISTFLTKLLFASTFLIPIILLEQKLAIIISIAWGLLALTLLSIKTAKEHKEKPIKVIREHLLIAIFVIIITHYVGKLISNYFGT